MRLTALDPLITAPYEIAHSDAAICLYVDGYPVAGAVGGSAEARERALYALVANPRSDARRWLITPRGSHEMHHPRCPC